MSQQASSSVAKGDRISALPDEIICIILSNLSVEESARTSILSKRWHKLWLLSPITISDKSIFKQSHTYSNQEESIYSYWIVNTLSHIIYTHPGPVHTCHFILTIWDEHHQTLVELLRTLVLKGIKNLLIYCEYDLLEVPCFILECKSLLEVELWCARIPAQSQACREIFPNLKKMTMVLCSVNHQVLVNLFASKSIIELKISACCGLKDVVIESDSLQKLSFSVGEYISSTELIIKDVPNLKSFNFYDLTSDSKVVILDAPKLKVLSCIDMKILMLQLGNRQFRFHKKYMTTSGEITHMPSVRSLNIKVDVNRCYEAKSVPHFLVCFPGLVTLKIKIIDNYDSSSSDDEYDDSDDDGNDYDNNVQPASNVNCLDHHLKNLSLENYSGRETHLDLANLIIGKATVLEKVTLVYGDKFERKGIKAQRQFLMQNRASKALRVEFLKSSALF